MEKCFVDHQSLVLSTHHDFFVYVARLCDEATSALDSSTEAEILSALKSLANNRTSIFIAHRLTTAMQCDEVKFLESKHLFYTFFQDFIPTSFAYIARQQFDNYILVV